MKAPDKIYIYTYSNGDHSYYVSSSTNCIDKQHEVEYIHKDVLLEFLNEKLQESADRLDFHTNKAYTEVLNKLNSL